MTTDLKNRALKLGASDFGISAQHNKRFYVIYDGKIIHFGSKNGSTYIDHFDDKKQKAWISRHSKIKNKTGDYVINLKTSPSYWSHKLLW